MYWMNCSMCHLCDGFLMGAYNYVLADIEIFNLWSYTHGSDYIMYNWMCFMPGFDNAEIRFQLGPSVKYISWENGWFCQVWHTLTSEEFLCEFVIIQTSNLLCLLIDNAYIHCMGNKIDCWKKNKSVHTQMGGCTLEQVCVRKNRVCLHICSSFKAGNILIRCGLRVFIKSDCCYSSVGVD